MQRHRLIIVGGKGGAGRTTVAAALGVALARRGRRTLLAHVRCNERLGELLGCGTVGDKIVPVEPNLWAVNMNPKAAIREMGMLVLRFRTLCRMVLENRLMRSFLRAVPALEEYSMIGKAWYHTTETDEREQPLYETVVFDGPATGHLIGMLRIPQVILDTVPEGPLTSDARKARAMLSDPTSTVMWLVTLAEEMAVSEVLDLYRAAKGELGIAVESLTVNALYPDDLVRRPDLAAAVEKLEDRAEASPIGPMIRSANTLRRRREINERYLEHLAQQLPCSRIELPHLFVPRMNREALELLVARIDAAL